jgi:UDP-N-acetylglucosamine 2-epimerase (non-hydrolysing)
MKKLKVMTVVGTRPEVIRLSRTIVRLDECFDHVLVHTGQNYDYELNQIFFDDLEIRRPDYFLDAAGNTGVETIGNVLIKVEKLLNRVCPEALLVLGDTNSGMALLAAKRRKIPTFHMEAGNRSFDMRVPEEINRKIIDHLADINMPYSDIAREYLIREGLPPDQIIKTGSPLQEVIGYYMKKIEKSNILEDLGLVKDKFFLISVHREENIEPIESFKKLIEVLNGLAEHFQLPIIVSTHPRTQKKFDVNNPWLNPLIKLIKPFGYADYNKLQISAKAVLSDSGSISEEASIMGFSAINLREAHERPEAMEEAAVIMTGLDKNLVLHALEIINSKDSSTRSGGTIVRDYCVSNVSDKVAKIILSYTDFVNRVVWKKY